MPVPVRERPVEPEPFAAYSGPRGGELKKRDEIGKEKLLTMNIWEQWNSDRQAAKGQSAWQTSKGAQLVKSTPIQLSYPLRWPTSSFNLCSFIT